MTLSHVVLNVQTDVQRPENARFGRANILLESPSFLAALHGILQDMLHTAPLMLGGGLLQ